MRSFRIPVTMHTVMEHTDSAHSVPTILSLQSNTNSPILIDIDLLYRIDPGLCSFVYHRSIGHVPHSKLSLLIL